MEKKPFYITTALPYVNAPPHIGFALEIVQADTIARARRQEGHEVVFNTGTDEHGLKIYRRALEEGKDPQAYVDEYAARFDRLKEALNLSYTHFIRTTDPHHAAAAQEFWRRCEKSGDIYKKEYQVKYCVGCELEKTDSELADGHCPLHPELSLELIEEENYFFRFSKYQKALLALYEQYPDFVAPAHRLTEIKNFVAAGLQDFSISRLKEKMPWGVPVPGNENHVMYVWFDALVNYVSTLGWPEDGGNFEKFWGTHDEPRAVQIAGKDNLRQQSAMWQAMLMAAGFPPSRQIIIHGFITSGGEKMSKSAGNVVDPFVLVERYGTDALRYWLMRGMNPFEDGNFTQEEFAERYEADLANGLGNFTARVLTLAERLNGEKIDFEHDVDPVLAKAVALTREAVAKKLMDYKFHEALAAIWELIGAGDCYVNEKKPWAAPDKKVLFSLVTVVDNVAALLQPFLPGTSEKITKQIAWSDHTITVTRGPALFPRLS
ncbi:MAG: methionine--tRNA ligase [Candidatus Jorgensenbacteria bacterium]